MKATGVIRRIDELGRIVIPKEIRKSLRIKESDNLEIYVDNENIVLKKYSVMKQLNDFAQDFSDAIHSFIKNDVLITDNDIFLAISGGMKKEYLNKTISEEIENKINRREEMLEKHLKTLSLVEGKEINCKYAVSPIISNGDTVGLVMIIGENVDELDFKITQIAAKFLNNYLS